MTGTRAAVRYAKAVLDLAKDQNVMEAVNTDMKTILSTITQSKEIQMVLKSPVIKASLKKASLKKIFTGISPLTNALIDILAENKRVALLGTVAEKYIILYDKLKGKEVAIVTTAVPLTAALEAKVLTKVKEFTQNEVTIENKIDESIIGGFILRIGDLQYNASIANKLNTLKRVFNTNFDVSTLN